MSWNPFVRHSAPKKSVISRTEEREFEKEVKKVERVEDTSRKLYKDTKRWVESNNALNTSEHKITQDLLASQLCQSEPHFCDNITDWDHGLEKKEVSMKELNSNVQKTLLEPMKKLNGIYPSVQVAVKKREQSLQEYMKCQAKMEKYQDRERTGQNAVKLELSRKALSASKEEFTNQNSALMEDLPKLMDQRIEYFQPSLEALIKSQITHNCEAHRMYTELSDKMSSHDSQNLTRQAKIQQTLADIKALSITADD